MKISLSRFCWGREKFAKGRRAVLAYHNFEQPPYDKQSFKLGYVVSVLSIWAVQHAER
jgi:hypothetical protein